MIDKIKKKISENVREHYILYHVTYFFFQFIVDQNFHTTFKGFDLYNT